MTRVAHVIDSLGVGGAQRLLTILSESGLSPTIIDLEGRESEFTRKLASAGAAITAVGVRRALYPYDWVKVWRAMRRTPSRIVHLHLTNAVLFGAPIAKLQGRKVVATLHNTRTVASAKRLSRLKTWVEAYWLRHLVDHVIHVGHNVEQANRGRLGSVTQTILPNVILPPKRLSVPDRAKVRAGFGVQAGDCVFLSTGRLNPQKDHGTMLQALALAVQQHPNIRLWIAGEGERAAKLQQLAQDLGLNGFVRFLGTGNDVDALLGAADVFVMSSAWEGLPLGLLEAMAAGLPTVATAVGDLPTVLADGGGLLVPKADPAALAEAMAQVVADAGLRARLATAAGLAVLPFLNVKGWLETTEAVYASVLAD